MPGLNRVPSPPKLLLLCLNWQNFAPGVGLQLRIDIQFDSWISDAISNFSDNEIFACWSFVQADRLSWEENVQHHFWQIPGMVEAVKDLPKLARVFSQDLSKQEKHKIFWYWKGSKAQISVDDLKTLKRMRSPPSAIHSEKE